MGALIVTFRHRDCTSHATVGSRELGSDEAVTLVTKTTLHSYYRLDSLDFSVGNLRKYQQNSGLLQHKVAVSIRVLGPTDHLTLATTDDLARAQTRLGRKLVALEFALRRWAICEELLDNWICCEEGVSVEYS